MLKFKRKFPWIGRKKVALAKSPDRIPEPLREFVYLDEVSLGSLLASQKGEITENITSQIGNEHVAEIGSKISASSPVLPSAEVNSRFQTTNSNALQTLRKATAQSLFRELHKMPNLRKIQPIDVIEEADSLENLFSGEFSQAIHNAADLARGDLVEFKVKLSASWIFQISSMVAEFSEMFDESPLIFMENIKFTDLYQAKNANKIIIKLLAGLVPVDGVVSDYIVVRYGDEKFIVHKDAIKNIDVEFFPLRIVGVTEHLAYWKDIRRILFADNEFTILCRLSKNGIQSDWNPIKVADIFKEMAPDLAKQIEVSSRTAMLQSASGQREKAVDPTETKFTFALAKYQAKLLEKVSHSLTESQLYELDRAIATFHVNFFTAEGQRAAFANVKTIVENATGLTIDSVEDLGLRESIRKGFGLSLFPQISEDNRQIAEGVEIEEIIEEANLLDVEVVAIYW